MRPKFRARGEEKRKWRDEQKQIRRRAGEERRGEEKRKKACVCVSARARAFMRACGRVCVCVCSRVHPCGCVRMSVTRC